ncbi:methyltransferase-like protein 16 isoform X1 [Carex littledalei]|uniref:U6 small nuclear RNA (adenine-(43)-N(6))-methyltransferase n=1 Tax=Carex littledalei TaxID=544730 RepID=A0A833R075_9POAL|nr:methyltransferase-like protein 16 isoform X1 [Carex littledalei]
MPRVNRKRRRSPAPEMHRNNRYKESPPDFSLLASLYPSFSPYLIFPSSSDRPTIDFTDFSATRELTRVLLLHDHGVNWWVPDGQLCPTVPNRSNYIHWIGDLLSSNLIPAIRDSDSNSEKPVHGFDIGTGANCIYPLLGASLLGWSFVGSDVTEVALEWARKNVESNPHILHLIEVRDARKSESLDGDEFASTSVPSDHVLVGVVKEGERFDFCMCNPPFFESIEDAGLNPKTACGGTWEEMVCPGGEQAFVSRIIEDSVSLKHSFRWFTSMVGRKVNLKFLISKIREARATVVKTTEFVQGQTSRWGLAWSFLPPKRNLISPNAPIKTNFSFMLEGLPRKAGAFQVLKSVETFFFSTGASCKSDMTSFSVNVTLSDEQTGKMLNDGTKRNWPDILDSAVDGLSFHITV